MKVLFNPVQFCSKENTYKSGNHTITETYNDNNFLERTMEFDEFGRDTDVKWYDMNGKVTGHMHKDYFETENEKGHVETFKNQFQEYTRKAYTKIEAGFRHTIDDYKSKTKPESSYINEFVYDMNKRLVKIITNGKVTVL